MKKITLWIVLALLQGCAAGPIQIENKEVPIDDQHSLAIGATVDNMNFVYIDDERYRIQPGLRFRGLYAFAIELPPGEHTLNTVSVESSYGYTRYPVDRSFTTTPGEVVNLGTVIVQGLSEPGKFVYGWVPNYKDTAKALSQLAPSWLSKELANGNYVMASGPYLGQKGLQDILVRRISPLQGLLPLESGQVDTYLTYDGNILGTIAVYDWQEKDGKLGASLSRIIFTDTTTNYYESCTGGGERLLCVASDTTLLDSDGLPKEGQSTRNLVLVDVESGTTSNIGVLPFNRPARSLMWRSDVIIVVDEDFNVYTSTDNADTWQSLATGVESSLLGYHLGGVKFEAYKDRILVHLSDSTSGEVQVDPDTGGIKNL